MRDGAETAILAGGCFWPAQELLRHRDGVGEHLVGSSEAGPFWEADAEDQDYLQLYPDGCQFPRL
jgi:peptide methionine sulfoxide reductase MsrA